MLVAQWLETSVQSAVSAYATTVSASLATALIPIAVAGMTIYFIFMGWAIARGEIQEPLSHIIKTCIKTALICAVALGGGTYQSYVINFISAIESVFTGAIGVATGGGAYTSVGQLIDGSGVTLAKIVARLFSEATKDFWPNLYLLVCACICVVGQVLIVVLSLIPLLVAKVTLALLMAIGPAFVLLALWPATVRFTEAWLSAALSAVMTAVVVAAVVGFMPALTGVLTGNVWTSLLAGVTNVMADVLKIFVSIVVLSWIAWKSAEFGAQVVGGATLGNPAGGLVTSYITRWMLRRADNPPQPTPSGGGSLSGKGGGVHPIARAMAQSNVMTQIAKAQRG
jgi:type IV secretion system protein VirB6